MESVYKLSKYSQKIDEACRTNQLNKVMEYNKHELAYINKLSKYFGNQKGGATVEQVFAAIREAINKQTAELQSEIVRLTAELQSAQQREGLVTRLEAELQKHKERIKQQNTELDTTIKESNETKQALLVQQSETRVINEKFENLQKEVQLIKSESTNVKVENTQTKELLKAKGTELESAQQQLQAKEAELASVRQQLSELQSKQEQGQGQETAHAQLAQELATTKKQLIIAGKRYLETEKINKEELVKVQQQHNDLQSTQNQLQRDLEKVTQEHNEEKTEFVKVQNSLQESNQQLQQELDTTKQELQELLQKLNQQVGSLPPAQATGSKGGSKRKK